MPLTVPPPVDQTMLALLRQLERHEDEGAAIRVRGWRQDGTTSHVRFTATRIVHLAQVHVQSTAAGEGGASYDADNFTSSTEVNLNGYDNRLVDIEVTRDGASHYYVYLIPVLEQADGSTVLCDGVSGPDLMSFIDLGS